MIPSTRYVSARENATGVGFGEGLAVGLPGGLAVGPADRDADGDDCTVGAAAPRLGEADGPVAEPGAGVDAPHAARFRAATIAAARTSLFIALTPKAAERDPPPLI
jgi:hypothetical protein